VGAEVGSSVFPHAVSKHAIASTRMYRPQFNPKSMVNPGLVPA
jgi:hypothetical protein